MGWQADSAKGTANMASANFSFGFICFILLTPVKCKDGYVALTGKTDVFADVVGMFALQSHHPSPMYH